jgi:hypothetical protein
MPFHYPDVSIDVIHGRMIVDDGIGLELDRVQSSMNVKRAAEGMTAALWFLVINRLDFLQFELTNQMVQYV